MDYRNVDAYILPYMRDDYLSAIRCLNYYKHKSFDVERMAFWIFHNEIHLSDNDEFDKLLETYQLLNDEEKNITESAYQSFLSAIEMLDD